MIKRPPEPQPSVRRRIVLTGGPGGGKSTAADLFLREMGERVVPVPEVATMMFSGGFPRSQHPLVVHAIQRAIYEVQRNIEDVQTALYPDHVLLCDRGTVDGAAYWPGESFFEDVGTTLEDELARYDAVIFFETAAKGGMSIESGNPVRTETLDEAVWLDTKLRAHWSRHPRFVLVPHHASFFKKIAYGMKVLTRITHELYGRPPRKKR
ncbi:MAG TPA: ATP-binding protein [Prosthecobacter sp.]